MMPMHVAGVRSRQFEMVIALQQSALDAAVRLDDGVRSAIMPGCALPVSSGRASRIFRGTADQVQAVRDFVRAGFAGHPGLDDAVLAASELSANAIAHSLSGRPGGMFMVHLAELTNNDIAVLVTDMGGPSIPQAQAADGEDESGRGLDVVKSVTSLLAIFDDSEMRSVLAVITRVTRKVVLPGQLLSGRQAAIEAQGTCPGG